MPLAFSTSCTMTAPSKPALMAIHLSGSASARATMRRTRGLVAFKAGDNIVNRGAAADKSGAATGDDALLDRRTRRGKRVLDAVLLLLELDLGCGADFDDGNAAGELGETLLELLAVPVRVGLFDLPLDLGDPTLDLVLGACAVDDRRVVLGDNDASGTAQKVKGGVLELEPDLFGDELSALSTAMSPSMALRLSPKPGALTATEENSPRILLTTRVARASPSTSSATINSGLPVCMTFSSTGTRS